MIKTVIKYIVAFVVTAGLLLGVLCLAAKIPRDFIRAHSLESAEYLCKGEQFGDILNGITGSRVDHYADSILLNIAWCYDTRYPLRSIMLSAYYYTSDHGENENYLLAVRNGMEPDQQYLRY